MIKTYLLVGMLCIPTIECFNFMEPNNKQYTKLETCLAEGKRLGDDMFDESLVDKEVEDIYHYLIEKTYQMPDWVDISSYLTGKVPSYLL